MNKWTLSKIGLTVAILAILFFTAIFLPALNKVRKVENRVICGVNLKGLGYAMTVYANDFDGMYVCQGRGAGHTWADRTDDWANPRKDWSKEGTITVGASLYLLVRLADVSQKSFVCPASDQMYFSARNAGNVDLIDLWDFGQSEPDPGGRWEAEGPARCVSYSYHQPYDPAGEKTGSPGRFRADDTRSAAFAVMADRNPWYDPKLPNAGMEFELKNYEYWISPIVDYWSNSPSDTRGGTERQKIYIANAQPHERAGQNVLFADNHLAHEMTPDVGIGNDNIYTRFDMDNPDFIFPRYPETLPSDLDPIRWRRGLWTEHPDRSGEDETPATKEDSFLVNDFVEKVR